MTGPARIPISVSRRGSRPEDSDAGCTIVWLRGEHDIATEIFLMVSIARAAQVDDGDVVVDLSEVTFMDASTIGALVGSRNRLGTRSRSLLLRAPSPIALRVLGLCGLAHLVHPAAVGAVHPTGAAAARRTWVDVPAAQASRSSDETLPSGRSHRPGRHGGPLTLDRPRSVTIEADRDRP